MGVLSIGTTPDLLATQTPKIWDLKTPPLNYGQMDADEAIVWIDRRCEIIVVANAPKCSLNSHKNLRATKFASTLAVLVPQFVGFSCSPWLFFL